MQTRQDLHANLLIYFTQSHLKFVQRGPGFTILQGIILLCDYCYLLRDNTTDIGHSSASGCDGKQYLNHIRLFEP